MGIFDKLKQGLSKTWRSLNTDVRDLFKSEGRLVDQPFLDEMRAMLFKFAAIPSRRVSPGSGATSSKVSVQRGKAPVTKRYASTPKAKTSHR